VVQSACLFWPPQFGKFPVNTTTALTGLVEQVFQPGGIWDRTSALFTRYNDDYCLRKETTRIEITSVADENSCPNTIDEEVLDEDPRLQDPEDNTTLKELIDGRWACEKDADPSDPEYQCKCSRRDVQKARPTDLTMPVVSIASRPSGCKMVHRGKCYGDCPAKFRPTWLKGWFRPVCTLVCADSNHPVTCGVGCASSRRACVGVILNMVKQVALAASKVAAFVLTGPAGLAVAETVVSVVKVAEFGFNVLVGILDVIDITWTTFRREEAQLATLIGIFQVVQVHAKEIFKNIAEFNQAMSASTQLLLTLIDAEFGWKDLNLGWITNSILQYGGSALQGAFQVVSSFAYRECTPASDEVIFTVEQIGDDRFIGPWRQQGMANGKKAYRLLSNPSKTLMEWSSRHKTWSFWYYDKSFGRGWWFGWAGFGWRELYYSKTPSDDFPKSGWRKDEGALPLPELVSATNGGV